MSVPEQYLSRWRIEIFIYIYDNKTKLEIEIVFT